MTTALEGGEWSAARPGRTLLPGKTRYPLYRRLGGPQGRSGRAENLVPTGIRSRTVKPLDRSLYRLSYPTHYEIGVRSTFKNVNLNNIKKWERLFMDGYECKRHISNATAFLTPLQNDRNKSMCLWSTLTSNNN